MEEPPFPVPRGMEWDPIKKRFFKPEPGTARAAVANNGGRALESKHGKRKRLLRERRTREQEQRAQFQLQAQADESDAKILAKHSESIPGSLVATSLRQPALLSMRSNAIPRMAAVQSSQKHFINQILTGAKASCAFMNNWNVVDQRISRQIPMIARRLTTSTTLGPLTFFSTELVNEVLCVNLAEMFIAHPDSQDENTLYDSLNDELITFPLSVYLYKNAWTAMVKLQTRPSSSCINVMTQALRTIAETPNQVENKNLKCFALDKNCLAQFSSKGVEISIIDTPRNNASQHQPRHSGLGTRQSWKQKVDIWLDESGIETLSIKQIEDQRVHQGIVGSVVVCIGGGKSAMIERIPLDTRSNTDYDQLVLVVMRYFFTFDSDIISHEISPSGRRALIGFRNGKIQCVDTPCEKLDFCLNGDELLEDGQFFYIDNHFPPGPYQPFEWQGAVPNVAYQPIECQGAITNVAFIAEDECIFATNRHEVGRTTLTSSQNTQEGGNAWQVTYRGHVNYWMLDVAMCVDLTYGVFALAGQDNKVRIWSFDRADPLRTSSLRMNCAKDEKKQEAATAAAAKDRREQEQGGNVGSQVPKRVTCVALQDYVFKKTIVGLTFCQRSHVMRDEAMRCETRSTTLSSDDAECLPRGMPAVAVAVGDGSILIFE